MVRDFKELRVYQRAFDASMQIFELSKQWPKAEKYGLTNQIRRSSRSVCANIGEAWFKRRYEKHFVSKLSDSTAEAAETLVWLDFAEESGYLSADESDELREEYRGVSGGLVKMMSQSSRWCGPSHVNEDAAPYHTDPS